MTLLEQLRAIVSAVPTGGSVTLPRDWLAAALGAGDEPAAPTTAALLTVADVAKQLHRSPSTVRGWLEAGRFEGAFKLNGRDWRIPAAALEAFLDGQRPGSSPQDAPGRAIAPPKGPRPRRPATGSGNLGAWRAARPAVSSPGKPT